MSTLAELGFYDRLSHPYQKDECYEIIDCWGRRGLCIGYRDYKKAENTKTEQGHGGQLIIFYYHDTSVAGVRPEAVTKI